MISRPQIAFITNIDSCGLGDQPADVMTLEDNTVLVVTETAVALYESVRAFESNLALKVIPRKASS